MIFFYQVLGVHVFLWLPRVVRRRVALPLYQVLKLTLASIMSVVDNGLDLVLFFIFDQVRRWMREVGSVSSGLSVGQEEGSVKYVMDTPRQGKGKSIGHR